MTDQRFFGPTDSFIFKSGETYDGYVFDDCELACANPPLQNASFLNCQFMGRAANFMRQFLEEQSIVLE